ncbi:MAG: PCRF domain-containing protein, partial [Campylobacterota bacterium]|nr:PCRF domain-containing protein [Campylobacterota bacterium]
MDNYEYTELLKNSAIKMENITGVVEPEKIKIRLNEIETLENQQEFWNDAQNAAKVQKEKTQLNRKLDKYMIAKDAIDDTIELYEMAKEENDDESIQTLFDDAISLEESIRKMEIEVLLSGDSDANNAIVSVHPGAGGTESQDWAEMLLRMYKKWAEKRNFTIEVLDYQKGDE